MCPGPWSSGMEGSISPGWQSAIRRRPPLATVSDTARRRPMEQAADKSRFTKASVSRAQCSRGRRRFLDAKRATSPTETLSSPEPTEMTLAVVYSGVTAPRGLATCRRTVPCNTAPTRRFTWPTRISASPTRISRLGPRAASKAQTPQHLIVAALLPPPAGPDASPPSPSPSPPPYSRIAEDPRRATNQPRCPSQSTSG